jgi:two-component system, NarL family, sensor histidine kinase BarA
LFVADDPTGIRRGPKFYPLNEKRKVDPAIAQQSRQALKTFLREPDERLVQIIDADEGREVYHFFRAVRVTRSCLGPACHDSSVDPSRQWKLNALEGLIVADLPGEPAAWSLAIGRLVIIGAGTLAFLLATMTFYFITQRLVLSPVRKLKIVADKAAEGDLTARTDIDTGDEFEQLGHSFDEMLEAVTRTQDQLRAANRALDLKLNELAEANTALFESNRLKSEFLANVSHELRTPLNSIIGFAELLRELADERGQRYAANILTSAQMLLRIINDLLDSARIEAGRVRLTVTQVSVADVCETLVSLVTPMAQKKNLSLQLVTGEGLPVIRTDAGKVQQILYNLLSNAIKYTPAGGAVTVTAEPVTQSEGVAVHVADTGPGISEAHQAHIFDKFYQAEPSVTREHGGAGLGLSIAKDLAGVLRGRLSLVSEPGKGATFTLTLPLEVPAAEG